MGIQHLAAVAYQGTTRYRYRVDGIIWEYSLDSALDDEFKRLKSRSPGRAYNYVKKFGKLVAKDGIDIE